MNKLKADRQNLILQEAVDFSNPASLSPEVQRPDEQES
jgi:hypothetical protein